MKFINQITLLLALATFVYSGNIWAINTIADIKANGYDQTISINNNQNLSVSISLEPGDLTGSNADWWMIANTPSGWYYYNYLLGWGQDIVPTLQIELSTVSNFEVLNVTGLPAGAYEFYFGIDSNMNGVIDMEQLIYDSIDVNITELNITYPIADTGQNSCYDKDGATITCPISGEAFYGQDAQFPGNQLSYSNNNNGTITDNVTGLIWQQSPAANGLSWQEAVDYCSSLELGDINDWRIPNTKELFSLSNFSQGWPYIDTNYFNLAGTVVSKDEQYWADYYVGTTAQGGSNAAFGVNHGTGHIKAYPANVSGRFGNYIRCVQGDNYGTNDFVDNGDDTITDNATGLMWEQSDSRIGMNWEDALIYAENSSTGEYNDWRLPNIKELQSIVDYTKSPSASDTDNLGPAIDTSFFQITELADGTTNYSPDYGYYWSSTSAYFGGDSLEYYYAWYVAFGTAVDEEGTDFHGAGGMRFDTKYEGGPLGEGGERYYNYVRLVRDIE